ncbi:hypothetical protein DXC92_27750 [Clostridiales bacterium TF09-2AC]|nr:hypothetical protein DXC92_27750 [Clostridiales bacterium TF09-2AC]
MFSFLCPKAVLSTGIDSLGEYVVRWKKQASALAGIPYSKAARADIPKTGYRGQTGTEYVLTDLKQG